MATLQTDTTKLYYEQTGTGSDIVWVSGGGGLPEWTSIHTSSHRSRSFATPYSTTAASAAPSANNPGRGRSLTSRETPRHSSRRPATTP